VATRLRVRGGKIGRKRIGGDRHTDESIYIHRQKSCEIFVIGNKYELIRKPEDVRLPAASANRCRAEGKTIAQR